ncbi:MAG: serine/threonine-protein phosphatase [Chloroflexi bacterium]|nr:serine/threonine-protein phosphatase [Chloroflexota bacterium]
MEVQVAVAKVQKYATSESGDTIEMIERPHGGISFVMADGQRSGRGAKVISNMVARKAISLLAEGVRDGAAARATHDYLYTLRGGKVQSTLDILSIDLVSRTVVISRNSVCPVIFTRLGINHSENTPDVLLDSLKTEMQLLDEPSQPIGVYPLTKPVIDELPLTMGSYLVLISDGAWTAGQRFGNPLDLPGLVHTYLNEPNPSAQGLTDTILQQVLKLERGYPGDDVTILVLAIVPRQPDDEARRLAVRFPI